MKSFLLRGKRPIIRWGMLPDEVYFEGNVPEGYSLAITPSEGYVIIDVDRHGDVNGFDNIPPHLTHELAHTLKYETKNNGMHFWFKYNGSKPLGNKASGKGIDLRTHKGYVVWYPEGDIRTRMDEIRKSSDKLNYWLEELFSYV